MMRCKKWPSIKKKFLMCNMSEQMCHIYISDNVCKPIVFYDLNLVVISLISLRFSISPQLGLNSLPSSNLNSTSPFLTTSHKLQNNRTISEVQNMLKSQYFSKWPWPMTLCCPNAISLITFWNPSISPINNPSFSILLSILREIWSFKFWLFNAIRDLDLWSKVIHLWFLKSHLGELQMV